MMNRTTVVMVALLLGAYFVGVFRGEGDIPLWASAAILAVLGFVAGVAGPVLEDRQKGGKGQL